jgi:hypothetical protein
MAQFYKGLNTRIKDTMAIQEFRSSWEALIQVASRFDDNFRRNAEEKKGTDQGNRFK